MKNNKGFTLTEILLAVMIVGIIGVALAALTTAASREGGVGRSKILLRNNLSIAMRQLREDIHNSSRVLYVRGRIDSASGGQNIPLLMLAQNVDSNDQAIGSGTPVYITYCFRTGTNSTALPSGALSEGTIYRYVSTSAPSISSGSTPSCSASGDVFLYNVKYIKPTSSSSDAKYYPVPLFRISGTENAYNYKDTSSAWKDLGSVLVVKLITERPSKPVVNDVVEETFVLPNGFRMD